MNKVYVYGSLRQGCGNYDHYLTKSEYLGSTQLEGFEMVSLGYFPAIYHGVGSVVVEAYMVDDLTFEQLDGLEGHPNWYVREEVETSLGKGWVYVLESERTNPEKVEGGDWYEYYHR